MTSERENWFPEVQALRALAVVFVVVFHAFPKVLRGGFVGIDIFFVISGFLITGHVTRAVESGSFTLTGFYVRRALRLFPAAGSVLLFSALTARWLVPYAFRDDTMREVVASALFAENWLVAATHVDYFRSTPTLVRHFWSLSVAGQLYLAWPLVVITGYWLQRRVPHLGRRALVWVLAIAALGSFACALLLTQSSPELAYLGTHARAWEFALGGLIALSGFRIHARLSHAFRLTGFAIIAACACYLRAKHLFPGWALLPALGASLVLIAGTPASATRTASWMNGRPIRLLSDASYSLYLWHWPLLLLVREYSHAPLAACGTVLAAACVSFLSCRYVEQPFRLRPDASKQRVRLALAIAGLLSVGAIAVGGFTLRSIGARQQLLADIERAARSSDPGCVGAQAMYRAPCVSAFGKTYAPDLNDAVRARLRNEIVSSCLQSPTEADLKTCTFGSKQAAHHVLLLGDSHAAHWAAPFIDLADEQGFHLTVATKSNCSVNLRKRRDKDPLVRDSCKAWVKKVRQLIKRDPSIDVVVTSSMNNVRWDKRGRYDEFDAGVQGYVETWKALLGKNRVLLAIGDTPRPNPDHLRCLSRGKDRNSCGNPREVATRRQNARFRERPDPLYLATQRFERQTLWFDPTNGFCDEERCPAVLGNVLVFSDKHHMTDLFARTFKPTLEPLLNQAFARVQKLTQPKKKRTHKKRTHKKRSHWRAPH